MFVLFLVPLSSPLFFHFSILLIKAWVYVVDVFLVQAVLGKPQSFAEKKMAVLWLKFLTEIDEKTRTAPQELLDNPEVSKALEIVEESAYSDAEMAAYEGYWDAVRREATFVGELDDARAELAEERKKLDAAKAEIEKLRQDKLNTAEISYVSLDDCFAALQIVYPPCGGRRISPRLIDLTVYGIVPFFPVFYVFKSCQRLTRKRSDTVTRTSSILAK